jgi:hypothetical protein
MENGEADKYSAFCFDTSYLLSRARQDSTVRSALPARHFPFCGKIQPEFIMDGRRR